MLTEFLSLSLYRKVVRSSLDSPVHNHVIDNLKKSDYKEISSLYDIPGKPKEYKVRLW